MPPRIYNPRWMPQPSRLIIRLYSTPTTPSTLKITSIPAPHAGLIKIISLNRPQARNAISRQLLTELAREIQAIASEGPAGPTRALILASETDGSFCAGADLKERVGFTEEETKSFLAALRHTFTSLSTLPIPTLSAIASTAFGGGLELALTTTMRVFASTAVVGLPETRLAIVPGAGGTYRLPALVGTARARDMVLTGRRVTAAEAYFMGLCDRLVEVAPEEHEADVFALQALREGKSGADREGGVVRKKVLDASVQVAREICEGGPVAVKAALEAVNCWGAGDEAENEAYEKVMKTQDRIEALRAFADKRAPSFKGR